MVGQQQKEESSDEEEEENLGEETLKENKYIQALDTSNLEEEVS